MARPHSARINTSLPEADLLFVAMEGTEELGRSFAYQIDVQSGKGDLKFEDLLGNAACVSLDLPNGETRYFHGFITDVAQTGRTGRYDNYRVHLRPWPWLLTRTADCKIYQAKTVPDIIKDVFKQHGFTDIKDSLGASYQPWDYCVQYRETAFNFVSRLMETEGIYYYFTHEADKHTLVLADSYSGHAALAHYPEIKYHPADDLREEHVNDWLVTKSMQPGTFALTDYDFEKPGASLGVNAVVQREHGYADFEVYDFPGEFVERSDGETYAKTRIEEIHSQYERVRGVGDVRGICAGGLFSLKDHYREDQNREYLVVATHHHFALGSYDSKGGGDEMKFQCRFEAMPSATPFRSARLTPRPLIQGPQTAVVVGPAGEEIYTDKYSRVKVKFHWDRSKDKDEKCSCWVRVSQANAGKNWGAIQIPRIGQEVVVEFMEGDPDLPIITGRVYNAQNMPPYPLPDNATRSTLFKSNSSKGGGGSNELRFEDKKGDEQIFIHAEKNMDIRVKLDRHETVGQNRHLVIEKDKHERVKNDRNEAVDNDHKETIGKDFNLKIGGKEAKSVKESLSLTVDGEVTEVFKDKHSETVTKDYYLKAKNIVIEGTTNVTVKVGESFIAIESGGIKIGTTGKVVLDATNKLEMKGTAGVKMESPANMEIEGLQTTVKGTAKAGVQAPLAEVKADGILTLSGSLVKIN
jgi:type VI secretion system secreted protein VgrG